MLTRLTKLTRLTYVSLAGLVGIVSFKVPLLHFHVLLHLLLQRIQTW